MLNTEIYLKHQRIIKNTAYKIAKRYNLEYADIEAQGNYIFCKVASELSYFKSNHHALLKRILFQDLTRYAKKESFLVCQYELSEYIYQDHFSDTILFRESFTPEIKEISNIIIENNIVNKTELQKKLQQKKWSIRKIKHIFFKIEDMLSEGI